MTLCTPPKGGSVEAVVASKQFWSRGLRCGHTNVHHTNTHTHTHTHTHLLETRNAPKTPDADVQRGKACSGHQTPRQAKESSTKTNTMIPDFFRTGKSHKWKLGIPFHEGYGVAAAQACVLCRSSREGGGGGQDLPAACFSDAEAALPFV